VSTDQLDLAKVAAARLSAVTRLPYLARALFACSPRAAAGSGTIAVDRAWHIHADPAVMDQLDADQLGRLLIHLAGHLVRDHATRAETSHVYVDNARGQWNRCADAEINDDLLADDCVPAVASELPADLGCDRGGLVEAYYGAATVGERRWDCGSGADAGPRPWDAPSNGRDAPYGVSPAQCELLRLGVAADIQHQHAQEPGTIPAGWFRWAETLLPSRTDWRQILAAEIRRAVAAVAGSVDYTYRRPARRARSSPGVVIPSMYRPVPDIAIVCDTSGSMHEQLLARALAEIESLLTKAGLRTTRTRVLAVDTAVHTVRRVSRARQVELAGGGGTDMGAGIAAAAALRPRPSIVIILTDGFTPWPDRPPPGIRVIVGLLTEHRLALEWSPPAWARTIRIEETSTLRPP
jgi:predicted metal-dependent peptidase